MRRNYLITGASSQIGQEVCYKALKSGGIVTALHHSTSKSVFGSLLNHRDFHAIRVDFSAKDSVEAFLQEYTTVTESTDIFIGLAATRQSVKYGVITSSDLMSHFMINTVPNVVLIQRISKYMQERRWGRILVGSSIGVKFGGGLDTYCYSLSKYAGELIPSRSREWARDGVLYNVLRIGVTSAIGSSGSGLIHSGSRTELIPMRRAAEPNEIAEYIYWLTSENNSYVTGQVLAISGGE